MSARVIQIRDVIDIIDATADGIIYDNIRISIPSLTPSPAGAKTANNPINPDIANAPVE